MDTLITHEITAYHGWGFDRTCWQGWADRFELEGIKFRSIDRGYFGAAIGYENPSTIIFVHSYGLHLCPIAELQQAKLLVIFSGFQTFHPLKEAARRRSQQILQQMLMQLENSPKLVLDNFWRKCGTLPPPIAHLNLELLANDLQDLGNCAIDLALLATLPQILIFHGSGDRIVPVQKGQEVANKLSGNSQYFEIANAGHALPFTDLEQCWSVVQQAVTQC
jgi:pimeloyl-[acyl-carrier protein] methyl ester esterase